MLEVKLGSPGRAVGALNQFSPGSFNLKIEGKVEYGGMTLIPIFRRQEDLSESKATLVDIESFRSAKATQ